jgi:putative transposase
MQERRNSGQSIKDFCQSAGISRNAYFYWQKKLREAACTELAETKVSKSAAPEGWMQLDSGPARQTAEVLLVEISGCRISVTADTDQNLLRKVCLALRSL